MSPSARRRPAAAGLAALLLAAWPAGAAHAQDRRFDLLTAGVAEIQAAVAAGALTYERLIQLYLNRIEAYDRRGPRLNAVLAVNPRALDPAGLPVSLELLGRPFSEPRLFAVAHAYERASRRRVAPHSTPHLPGEVFTY